MTAKQRYLFAMLLTELITPQSSQPANVSPANAPAFFQTATGQVDWFRVAGCAGIAALTGAGAYALYDYFHISNPELIADTRQLLLQAEQYQPLLSMVQGAPSNAVPAVSEPTLAQMTEIIGAVSIRQYLDELEKLQRQLNANVTKLGQRRQKLMRKVLRRPSDSMTQAEHQVLIDVMSALERTAQPVQQQLYVLQRYLSAYFGYFTLAQIHTEMRKKYGPVLQAANDSNPYYFKRAVRGMITDQAEPYPLLTMAQTLRADLDNLAHTAHRFGYEQTYPQIMVPICELEQALAHVYRLITADSEYAAEQHRFQLVGRLGAELQHELRHTTHQPVHSH